MEYFNSTFFDRYTALTEAQIREKLTPVPAPKGGAATGLAGRELRLVLDNGRHFAYRFGETLSIHSLRFNHLNHSLFFCHNCKFFIG